MTDAAERKVRLWALRKNGDPLSPQDVVELVYAFADDQEADHGQTIEMLAQMDAKHSLLCTRVAELEGDWHEASATCKDRVEAIVRAEHGLTHAAHMADFHAPPRREDDPPDEAFVDKRKGAFPTGDQRTVFEMVLGFNIAKWLLTLAVGALIVWGVSYWASSCAAQKVEEDFIHSGGEVHLIVPSPSPSAP